MISYSSCVNFPGFCKEPEPKEKSWDLEDYANFVNEFIKKTAVNIDYILGYSFGGAVAVSYNRLYNNNQKLILISPAIIREYKKSKNFIQTPKIVEPIRNILRDLYLIHIAKTNEMVYGTQFLRNSYQQIVRIELLNQLEQINPNLVTIIYGDKDEMVNPHFVLQNIKTEYHDSIHLLPEGRHDIANTHTDDIMQLIRKVTK